MIEEFLEKYEGTSYAVRVTFVGITTHVIKSMAHRSTASNLYAALTAIGILENIDLSTLKKLPEEYLKLEVFTSKG